MLSGEIPIGQIITSGIRAAGDRIRGVATVAAVALRAIAGLLGGVAGHDGAWWPGCPPSMPTNDR